MASEYKHFQRCYRKMSPQRAPPEGHCTCLWTMYHLILCTLPSTRGNPKCLPGSRAGKPGIGPLSRARTSLQAGSSVVTRVRPGRRSLEKPKGRASQHLLGKAISKHMIAVWNNQRIYNRVKIQQTYELAEKKGVSQGVLRYLSWSLEDGSLGCLGIQTEWPSMRQMD